MENLFDEIVLAEDSFHKEGFDAGVKRAQVSGYWDGYKTGLEQAGKVGAEGDMAAAEAYVQLGFYLGFVMTWKALLEAENSYNGRKQKAMDYLIQLIESFPQNEPETKSLQVDLQTIRAKFKQVSSLLNVSFDDAGQKPNGASF